MSALKDTIEKEWMDSVTGFSQSTVPAGSFLALYSVAPTDTTEGTEATGGGGPYARQAITWGAITANVLENSAAVTFSGMPAGTWVACAIHSAVSGAGNQIAYGALQSSVTTSLGESVTFDPNALRLIPTNVNATPFLGDKLLDHFFLLNQYTSPTLYQSLHNGAPGDNGANEFVSGSYSRQFPTFDQAVNGGPTSSYGVSKNSGTIEFTGLDAADTPYRWWGFFDALTVGNFLWRFDRGSDLTITTGDKVQFTNNEVQIGVH